MSGKTSGLAAVCQSVGKVLQEFPCQLTRPVFLVLLAMVLFLLTVQVLKKRRIFVFSLLRMKTTFDSFVLCTFAVGFYFSVVTIGYAVVELVYQKTISKKAINIGKYSKLLTILSFSYFDCQCYSSVHFAATC